MATGQTVNPAAAGYGGVGSFTGGGSTGTTGTSVSGSSTITLDLPANVAKKAGVPTKWTGTAKNLATQTETNAALAMYFNQLALAQGGGLFNAKGKFNKDGLEGVFEGIAADQLSATANKSKFDPTVALNTGLKNLGAYRSQQTAAKQPAKQAADISNSGLVQPGDPAAARVNVGASVQAAAANSLETFLQQYGINDTTVPPNLLNGFVKQFSDMVFKQNIVPTSVTAKEMFQNYDGGKLYDAAFPGLAAYNKTPAGQTAPMSITDFNTYRQNFERLTSLYNLPPQFLGPDTLRKMVTNGVSIAELSDRIAKGYDAYQNSSPAEKQLLSQQYGISPGQAVAYFLDPKNGLDAIKQAMTAAPLELKAQQVGLTDFTKQNAEQLAGLVRSGAAGQQAAAGTPYDFSQAYAAETQAARDAALTQQRMNQSPGTKLDTNTLLTSQVAGYTGDKNVIQGQTQAGAQRAVQTAEQAAVAPFQKGGGYEETQKGVIGAGSARQ